MWDFETLGCGDGEEIVFGGMAWMVLDKTPDERRKLLLCKDSLHCGWPPKDYSWQDQNKDYTWEASGVRAFLNGQYISDHFSEDEKARIREVQLENKGNPFGDKHDCPATIDRAFMLSLSEAAKYFAANHGVESYCLLENQVFYTRTPLSHEWDVSPIRFILDDDGPSISVEHMDEINEAFPNMSFVAFGLLDAWTDVSEDVIDVRPALWLEC